MADPKDLIWPYQSRGDGAGTGTATFGHKQGHADYDRQRGISRSAAQAILPIVFKYVQPRSVLDVGCGMGAWLSVFLDHGINDIIGVDGDWVPKDLCIPRDCFVVADLKQPLNLGREFDLVLCLEVAEHLPTESAEQLVETLTRHARVVLFSAALVGQGGRHHVNEQWPEYWMQLFNKQHYAVLDCVRGEVWNNETVPYWFRQNTLMYVHDSLLVTNERLRSAQQFTNVGQLALFHPRAWLARIR